LTNLTPMMRQYFFIKEQHKDALLFFRLGDFYELFFEDAKIASKELEIVLTGRDCGSDEKAPMCGVPHHAADNYIIKLINKGYKVAICEQTQDAKDAKGIVERDVVRIITPGTVTTLSALDEKNNNFLAALSYNKGKFGLAIVDITTGEFFVSQYDNNEIHGSLLNELGKISPSEVIISENLKDNKPILDYFNIANITSVSIFHEWAFDFSTAYQKLLNYFSVQSLEGYGCEKLKAAISAAGALLEYVSQTQKSLLRNINKIQTYHPTEFMIIDNNALRNLEIVENSRERIKRNSLLWHLDSTKTAAGARLLRSWLLHPLKNIAEINRRQKCIIEFIKNSEDFDKLRKILSNINDIERLCGRISAKSATPRDLIALKESIFSLPLVIELLESVDAELIQECVCNIDLLKDISSLIEQAIINEPSITLKEGNIIKSGFSDKLDKLRFAMKDGRTWIANLEQEERLKTGIKNLKAGFNKVFGYYLEVTKSYYELVPDYFIRKQTLANCERFITPELKDVEVTILGAEEKSITMEYELFVEVRDSIGEQIERIQKTAKSISIIDVLSSLTKVSIDYNYVCPEMLETDELTIVGGRHPLVEKMLPAKSFIPNDTTLNSDDNRVMIITGPNMAGKSTYLRQVALIVIMAQIGCFIPAESAKIGLVDKVFTRIGASDDLISGQSTFMMEMNEVANILNNLTSRSLLILDEIGRGTSTFDGLSIAWSVIEYISRQKSIVAKTLFATHYHELTELEGKLAGVKNYCISVKEQGDNIIFLRKIIRGGADKSFGIQVAKLAGLPPSVIKRANEILQKLEEADINNLNRNKKKSQSKQLSMFQVNYSAIEEELASLDVYTLTPIEAINLLYSLSLKAKSEVERMKNNDSGFGFILDKSNRSRRSD